MESQVGKVIILKNLIFKKTHMRNKTIVDHAYKKGRPAIVICETDEKIYHLVLTHSRYIDENEKYRYFTVMDENNNISYVDFSEIHSRPLCFERECEYIEDEYMKDILIGFCEYQESICKDEEYEEIKPYIYNMIEEISNKQEFCLKKEKK